MSGSPTVRTWGSPTRRRCSPNCSIGTAATCTATWRGLLPADVRAALYRALARVPGMEIADSAANLDGKIGVAFGIQHASERDETIIDPTTGAFIGESLVATEGEDTIPAGTVTGYAAVSTTIVDTIGQAPKR